MFENCSAVNLMLGCLLFKKFKKFNETCSLSKAAKISSLFEKCCNFYPNNFEFCTVKQDY